MRTFMLNKKQRVGFFSMVLALLLTVSATAKSGSKSRKANVETTEQANAVFWRNPEDIKSRNLFYGAGGEAHAPHTTYTFEKEDMEGTSPKFTVRDENGVRWKVKMGHEARPETVACKIHLVRRLFHQRGLFPARITRRRNARAPPPWATIHRTAGDSAQCSAKEVFGRREKGGHLEVGRQPFLLHQRTQRPPGDDGAHQQLGFKGH